MNPDKLKLLQKLSLSGDENFIQKGKTAIINAISKMDSMALEIILDDNISYDDTSKSIFIKKLKDIFEEFLLEDKYLNPYEGKCNSSSCNNHNKSGVVFIGNNSGRYLNLIIEENQDGSVKDIYDCFQFCPYGKIVLNNKKQMSYMVFSDEKVNFKPSVAHIESKNEATEALKELEQYHHSQISKEQIISWIKNHVALYDSLEFMGHDSSEIHNKFYLCFSHIEKIYNFILFEEFAGVALTEFKLINDEDEMQLLRWLVNFEHYFFELISFHPNIVPNESMLSGKIILHKDFNAYFQISVLENCIELAALFNQHYYAKFNKYTTITEQEFDKMSPLDDEYSNYLSLKHHLTKRGII